MQEIYHFLDYREYLASVYEERKVASPWFSCKVMGDAVGLDQSQVFRILKGQLHVSKAALPRFIQYLKLDEKAAEYMHTMVAFAKARKAGEARILFAKLLDLRGTKAAILQQEQYLLYQEWYHSVVRTILATTEFRGDYIQLSRSLIPAITEAQARKSVDLLEKLGLVFRNSKGIWQSASPQVTTGSAYQSMMVRNYQGHSFALASRSLDECEPKLRDINVINMALDAQAFTDCVAILKEARRQIQERLESVDRPDRVMRLAQAFFPVGKT